MMYLKKIPKSMIPHVCDYCGKSIPKGTVYYREKHLFKDGGEFLGSYTVKVCSKCLFKRNQRIGRFKRFKSTCKHKIKDTVYGYIPGECVMEPQYDECLICGARGV